MVMKMTMMKLCCVFRHDIHEVKVATRAGAGERLVNKFTSVSCAQADKVERNPALYKRKIG